MNNTYQLERIEAELDSMHDALEAQGFRREAFFGLLGSYVFFVCDPLMPEGEVPLPSGIHASHHILSNDWILETGVSRRVLRIKPSTLRRFSFQVEQYGTALEIRVDGYGSNNRLADAIEEVLLIIESTLNVTIRRSDSGTTVIVRLDAEHIFDDTQHLEDAMRAVSLIFDQAIEHCSLKNLH